MSPNMSFICEKMRSAAAEFGESEKMICAPTAHWATPRLPRRVLPPAQHGRCELVDVLVVAGEAVRRREVLGEVALELLDQRRLIAVICSTTTSPVVLAVVGDRDDGGEALDPRSVNLRRVLRSKGRAEQLRQLADLVRVAAVVGRRAVARHQ